MSSTRRFASTNGTSPYRVASTKLSASLKSFSVTPWVHSSPRTTAPSPGTGTTTRSAYFPASPTRTSPPPVVGCGSGAFPNLQPQSRAVVYRSLDELHTVRNRIAHHEPVHGRDLTADTLTIYRLLDWIDADVRAWAVSLSRLQPLIAARPN